MERAYRRAMQPPDLVSCRVVVGETDLWLAAECDLSARAGARVRFYRRQLRAYMARDPHFVAALAPLPELPGAPPLVLRMLAAGRAAGVGPMAAVAGAIAQAVGEDLAAESAELVLENGGDLYLRSRRPRIAVIHAGASELSGRLGLALPPCPDGMGVCTSAGTVGPSLSFGRADAATIVAQDAALADAAATALGNRLRSPADLEAAVAWAAELPGVRGALAIMGSHLAAAGELELAPIESVLGPG